MNNKYDTNRWLIAAAGVVMQVALGAVYAWSVFRIPLHNQYGWSVSQITLAFEIAILVLGFAAFVGRPLDEAGRAAHCRHRGRLLLRARHHPGGTQRRQSHVPLSDVRAAWRRRPRAGLYHPGGHAHQVVSRQARHDHGHRGRGIRRGSVDHCTGGEPFDQGGGPAGNFHDPRLSLHGRGDGSRAVHEKSTGGLPPTGLGTGCGRAQLSAPTRNTRSRRRSPHGNGMRSGASCS